MTVRYIQLGLSISSLGIETPEDLERIVNAVHKAALEAVRPFTDGSPDVSTDILESAGKLEGDRQIDDLGIYGGEWRYQPNPDDHL